MGLNKRRRKPSAISKPNQKGCDLSREEIQELLYYESLHKGCRFPSHIVVWTDHGASKGRCEASPATRHKSRR